MFIRQVSALPLAQVTGTGAGAAPQTNLNYDSFLKLLIASMKNQDPTKPNDPAETMSQLASFSAVEQSIKLNEKLEYLVSVSSAGQAAGLVGKSVSNLDGTVSGTVKSVELTAGGLTLILKGGNRLAVSGGIRIS
jgi:flagellar basal-body rod modification protein FlgD